MSAPYYQGAPQQQQGYQPQQQYQPQTYQQQPQSQPQPQSQQYQPYTQFQPQAQHQQTPTHPENTHESYQAVLPPTVTPGWNDPPPLPKIGGGAAETPNRLANMRRRPIDPSITSSGGSQAYGANPYQQQQQASPYGAPQQPQYGAPQQGAPYNAYGGAPPPQQQQQYGQQAGYPGQQYSM